MLCRVIPYEGREPYIFFSYSHKDAERVYPILEQMARDGYRVWYDDGNHPGDDWLENIGQHLNNCHVCLAMMSKNSEASHNCKKEVSFAVQCQKKLMAVMLEKFAMTVGMRMQLSDIHYLEKENFPSNAALLAKLYETEDMRTCRGVPGSMQMRMVEEEEPPGILPKIESAVQTFAREAIPRQTVDKSCTDTVVSVVEPEDESAKKKHKIRATIKKKTGDKIAEMNPTQEIESEMVDRAQMRELDKCAEFETVNPLCRSTEVDSASAGDVSQNDLQESTESDENRYAICGAQLLLVRPSDGSCYFSDKTTTKVGRSELRCDMVLKNNPMISNHHIDIILENGKCSIRDVGSSYGTCLNGAPIERGAAVNVKNGEKIVLHKEEFVLFFGASIERWRDRRIFAYLCNSKTHNIRMIEEDAFSLGRLYKWEDGALSNTNISRRHAQISWNGECFCLEDLKSKNGTFCNEQKLNDGEIRILASGDKIRLVDTTLEINIVAI